MRRSLLVVVLGVVALGATAQAGPAPQVTDQQGDWQVASQDIVSARVSSLYAHGMPTLRGEVNLAAAPDPNLPSNYFVSFNVGCLTFVLVYSKDGPTDAGDAQLWREECASGLRTAPATFAISGTTLTMQVPYALGLKQGMKAQGLAATVYTTQMGVNLVGFPGGDKYVFMGDVAYAPAKATYVLGSDLPRR